MPQRSESNLKQFRQEYKHLQDLKHTNIVRLLAACDGEQALITEHCERGSLADMLAKEDSARLLTEERKWQLLLQLAHALEFLHSRKPAIVHRDIKTSNVLVRSLDFYRVAAEFLTAGDGSVAGEAGRLRIGAIANAHCWRVDCQQCRWHLRVSSARAVRRSFR